MGQSMSYHDTNPILLSQSTCPAATKHPGPCLTPVLPQSWEESRQLWKMMFRLQ